MHHHNQELIKKIEGHADLHIDWEKNKVFIEVLEGERLFEGLLVGRPIKDLAWITARICGICSIAHTLASLKAGEAALGLKIPEWKILLRRLLLCSQIIQSHIVHLFYLALPDYLGLDSGVELASFRPEYFKLVNQVKEVSDELTATLAGHRLISPRSEPLSPQDWQSFDRLKEIKTKLSELIPLLEKTVKIFGNLQYPELNLNLVYLSQLSDKSKLYNIYDSQYLLNSQGEKAEIKDYQKFISEEVKKYSTAKFGKFSGRPHMVGAIARIFLQKKNLRKRAKELLKKYPINFQNPFYNNLAQALETLHFCEESIELINKLEKVSKQELKVDLGAKAKQPTSVGIGAIEAPRGGLYHQVEVDDKGIIRAVNIITPTVQNLASLEETSQALLDKYQNQKKEKIKHLMEMLIRAYDPCLTCAVH